MKTRLPLIASLLAASAALSPAGDVRVEQDIPYLEPGRAEKMDAYLPADSFARPLPAVLWIHGGGWIEGGRRGSREINVCRDLAEAGYAAFSIDYKLGKAEEKGGDPEGRAAAEAPWPQNLADCKSALRFLDREAARFGVDPARIAVAGGSAGGHLALLTGLTAGIPEMDALGLYGERKPRVRCIVDMYGPTELTIPRRVRIFAAATPEATAENLRRATPATWLGAGAPPVLVIHGDADTTVPPDYSRRFAADMEKVGVPHQLVIVPGAGHAFDLQPKQRDLRPVVLDFLARNLAAAN